MSITPTPGTAAAEPDREPPHSSPAVNRGHAQPAASEAYRGQAGRYDRRTEAFQPWRERLVERLPVRPGDTVLDVGCGTGLGIGNGQRPIDAIARLASTDEGSAWRYSSTEERASNLPSAPVRAFLEALDMSLHRTQGFGAQELDFLLREGGSAWVVAEDGLSLVRRVPEEEAAALAQAIKPEEEASNHLQAAWAKVYGRHPDADEAWSQAIKACEAIFIPIVEPGKPRTTLGTTLRALRQHPELFDVRLTHNPAGGSVMDELIAMLDVVWVDPNRHGGQAEPRHATIEDAENIGQLAVSWSAGRGLVSSQGSHRHSDNDAISGVRPRRPYGRLAIRR